jgi:hypothetical protein
LAEAVELVESILPTHADSIKKKITKCLQLTGTGSIYANYAEQPALYSSYPANYLQADLHPTVSIGLIPIGADWQYCSAENSAGLPLNRFSLRFDAPQFAENLKRKIVEKAADYTRNGELNELAKLAHYKELLLKEQLPELDHLRDTLSSLTVATNLQALQQKEQLATILSSAKNDPFVRKQLDSLGQWQQRYTTAIML